MEEEEDYGVTNAKEKYMLEDKENYEVTDQECTDFIDLEESAWSINLNQVTFKMYQTLKLGYDALSFLNSLSNP